MTVRCHNDCITKYNDSVSDRAHLSIGEHMLEKHYIDVKKMLRDATSLVDLSIQLGEIPNTVDVIRQLHVESLSLLESHGSRISNDLENKIVDAIVEIKELRLLSWNLIGYNAENVIKIINMQLCGLRFNIRKDIDTSGIFDALGKSKTITELKIGSMQNINTGPIVEFLKSTMIPCIDLSELYVTDDIVVFNAAAFNTNITSLTVYTNINITDVTKALQCKHHRSLTIQTQAYFPILLYHFVDAVKNNYNIISGNIDVTNVAFNNAEYIARNRLILPENVHSVLVDICIALLPRFDNIYCIMWIFDRISEHYYRHVSGAFKIGVIMKVKQSIDAVKSLNM